MALDKTGKVKFYNEEKSFGFIELDGGGSAFFHRTALSRNVTAKKDMRVRCEVEASERGPRATRVVLD